MSEIIAKIEAVISALDNIEVKRRQNLISLAGCIGVLDDVVLHLKRCEESEETQEDC